MTTYEKLLQMGVFTINDVDKLYSNRNSSASAVRSLLKKGLVTAVKKNLYICNDFENKTPVADRFKIGSCITQNSYISHHTAFEFYGIVQQVFFVVYVSSENLFHSFDFNNMTYRYVGSKSTEGVEVYKTDRGARVTNLERTVVDCIKDPDKAGGYEELLNCLELIHYLDENKLLRYLQVYNIQFLYQKAGFFLEHFKDQFNLEDSFFETCLKRIVKSKRYLTHKGDADLIYDSKWKLYIPKNIFDHSEPGGKELV